MTLDFKPLEDYFQTINRAKKEWVGFTPKEIQQVVDLFWSDKGPCLHKLIEMLEIDLKERNQ